MVKAYRSQYGSEFISVMPSNQYGSGDNYHPEHSHVIAALIAAFTWPRSLTQKVSWCGARACHAVNFSMWMT